MRIEIVEVTLDGYNTTYRITATDDNEVVWRNQREVYGITDYIYFVKDVVVKENSVVIE